MVGGKLCGCVVLVAKQRQRFKQQGASVLNAVLNAAKSSKKRTKKESFKLKNSVRKFQWLVGGKILDDEDYERVELKELEQI